MFDNALKLNDALLVIARILKVIFTIAIAICSLALIVSIGIVVAAHMRPDVFDMSYINLGTNLKESVPATPPVLISVFSLAVAQALSYIIISAFARKSTNIAFREGTPCSRKCSVSLFVLFGVTLVIPAGLNLAATFIVNQLVGNEYTAMLSPSYLLAPLSIIILVFATATLKVAKNLE